MRFIELVTAVPEHEGRFSDATFPQQNHFQVILLSRLNTSRHLTSDTEKEKLLKNKAEV